MRGLGNQQQEELEKTETKIREAILIGNPKECNKTFTELLNLTGLSRSTLSVRLRSMIKKGSIKVTHERYAYWKDFSYKDWLDRWFKNNSYYKFLQLTTYRRNLGVLKYLCERDGSLDLLPEDIQKKVRRARKERPIRFNKRKLLRDNMKIMGWNPKKKYYEIAFHIQKFS